MSDTMTAAQRALADSPLRVAEGLTEPDLRLFAEYGFETLGDLLGATCGLTEIEWLRDAHDGAFERAVALRESLPQALLDHHAETPAPMPPMGWFPEENDDDDA